MAEDVKIMNADDEQLSTDSLKFSEAIGSGRKYSYDPNEPAATRNSREMKPDPVIIELARAFNAGELTVGELWQNALFPSPPRDEDIASNSLSVPRPEEFDRLPKPTGTAAEVKKYLPLVMWRDPFVRAYLHSRRGDATTAEEVLAGLTIKLWHRMQELITERLRMMEQAVRPVPAVCVPPPIYYNPADPTTKKEAQIAAEKHFANRVPAVLIPPDMPNTRSDESK